MECILYFVSEAVLPLTFVNPFSLPSCPFDIIPSLLVLFLFLFLVQELAYYLTLQVCLLCTLHAVL
jgi:hypothetical protein